MNDKSTIRHNLEEAKDAFEKVVNHLSAHNQTQPEVLEAMFTVRRFLLDSEPTSAGSWDPNLTTREGGGVQPWEK